MHNFLPKKTGRKPCFFISADAKLILVSRGVVAKTNLTHHYAGIRCGLINQRGVITAVLADSNIGVFSVPLVDGGIVSETILSQFNSTIIRTWPTSAPLP